MLDHFALDGCEEAFCYGVVPAVALAAHALDGTDLVECCAVVAARIHAAPVGMMDQAGGWPSRCDGAVQSAESEDAVAFALADRPTTRLEKR